MQKLFKFTRKVNNIAKLQTTMTGPESVCQIIYLKIRDDSTERDHQEIRNLQTFYSFACILHEEFTIFTDLLLHGQCRFTYRWWTIHRQGLHDKRTCQHFWMVNFCACQVIGIGKCKSLCLTLIFLEFLGIYSQYYSRNCLTCKKF